MRLGYARVSTEDQDTTAQQEALQRAGVDRIYVEQASGGRWDRPELQRMLDQLREGDVVVVVKLDRLTRSLRDLLRVLERIETAGAGFCSLTEAVDTTTAGGRMMMQLLGAFAEFERSMVRERTRAGLQSARCQGRIGGRPRKLSPEQEAQILANVERGIWTAAEAARLFGVHPSTVSRLRTSPKSGRPGLDPVR